MESESNPNRRKERKEEKKKVVKCGKPWTEKIYIKAKCNLEGDRDKREVELGEKWREEEGTAEGVQVGEWKRREGRLYRRRLLMCHQEEGN